METSKTLVKDPEALSDSNVPEARLARPRRILDKPGKGAHERVLMGRYHLLERLGSGGFGTVWHAHDEQLDRSVALKQIALPAQEDRHRAMREALATARLCHPAIVSLYEANAEEDCFYLISELVHGETLARAIADDRLSDEEILEIGIALVGALEHAHARGVIHRDVKPQNVLLPALEHDRDGPRAELVPAKLADFGGARVAGEDALTRAGDVLGTLAYMAPEQSEGHEVGPPADLYSLALVLYEALSGANPVRGATPAATARRIGVPIAPLARSRRDLPRELTRAIDVALCPDARRRGTLADLREALESALERDWRGEATAVGPADDDDDERARRLEEKRTRHAALPRAAWLAPLVAGAILLTVKGQPGAALLVIAAGAPLLALPRRGGPGWLIAAFAPVLGIAGLAMSFPALAGQRAGVGARAGLAALGFWWLTLAEVLLGKRLWLGPPSGLPARGAWEASLRASAVHAIAASVTVALLVGALVWALAAAALPWLVRGRHVALDLVGALVWAIALLAATPLLEGALLTHPEHSAPRGAVLGAVLACALAVGARALRGPVRSSA